MQNATTAATVTSTTPRKRGRPKQVDKWAEVVFNFIPTDGSFISTRSLVIQSGLRVNQVRRAVAYLRDLIPDLPLVSRPRKGYAFTTNVDDVDEFRKWRLRAGVTTLNRAFHGAVLPALQQAGASPREVQSINKSWERLLGDIEDVMVGI